MGVVSYMYIACTEVIVMAGTDIVYSCDRFFDVTLLAPMCMWP